MKKKEEYLKTAILILKKNKVRIADYMDYAGKRSESRIRRIALISRILVTPIIANNLIRAIF